MTRIVLHIDRLTLNGYSRSDGNAVAEGLRNELARYYAEPGAAQALRGLLNLDRLQAGRVPVPAAAAPAEAGRQAARGIAKGMVR